MIEDSPVVNDLRQIRQAISKRFDHDLKKYLDYLRAKEQAALSETMNSSVTAETLPLPNRLETQLETPGQSTH